jgi:protein-disulfide isomerase
MKGFNLTPDSSRNPQMIHLNRLSRRNLMLAAAASALVPATARAQEANLTDLNVAPAIGEMALGPETAKVTIIEYASASCPHCRDFYKDVFVPLKKDYIDTGKVRFIFREFPHNDAGLAAFMLARSLPKEKYFPVIDIFFETQDKWTQNPMEGLKAIAQQAGLTEEQFTKVLQDEKAAKDVLAIRDKGSVFGVKGIPTIFINGKPWDEERTFEKLKATIDPLLAS